MVSFALALVTLAVPGTPSVPAVAETVVPNKSVPCPMRYKQDQHRRRARKIYGEQKRVTSVDRFRLRRMRRCAYSQEAAENMRGTLWGVRKHRKLRVRAAAREALHGGAPNVVIPPVLESIAQCESGGDPQAISAGGTYRGKYQFSFTTWGTVGGEGDPAAASETEQDRRAAMLYHIAGPVPWPVCGR